MRNTYNCTACSDTFLAMFVPDSAIRHKNPHLLNLQSIQIHGSHHDVFYKMFNSIRLLLLWKMMMMKKWKQNDEKINFKPDSFIGISS